MSIPTCPAWWPPSDYEELTETQVRELLASLRTVTPFVMADGERRIRDVVGPSAEIRLHHEMVKSLATKRLGRFEVMKVIILSAGSPQEDQHVRFAIGIHRDGSIMVTPDLNPATHLVWKRWASSNDVAGSGSLTRDRGHAQERRNRQPRRLIPSGRERSDISHGVSLGYDARP